MKANPSMDLSKGNSGLSDGKYCYCKRSPKPANDSKNKLNASLEGQGKIIRNGIIQMETLSFDDNSKADFK